MWNEVQTVIGGCFNIIAVTSPIFTIIINHLFADTQQDKLYPSLSLAPIFIHSCRNTEKNY